MPTYMPSSVTVVLKIHSFLLRELLGREEVSENGHSGIIMKIALGSSLSLPLSKRCLLNGKSCLVFRCCKENYSHSLCPGKISSYETALIYKYLKRA